MSPQRHLYGADPSQFADLHLPAGRRHPGTVVLIHGGWWGPRFGAGHLDGVAADLAGRDWVTWNIEYRRLGLGGGYPPTFEDAAAAIELLGGAPDELPGRYAVADPLSHVPVPAVVRCVHAHADDRVPFAQSVTYVAAARAAGQDAQLVEADGDHFSVADATAPAWAGVIRELETLMGAK